MTVKSKTGKKNTVSSKDWKTRYEKQKFIVNSMTSLLNRYGSSIEPEQLYSAFLLTLMGQFVVTDSCYYCYDPKSGCLEPAISFGRLRPSDLLPLHITPDTDRALKGERGPASFDDFPADAASKDGVRILASYYRIISPLHLKEQIVGVLFLGEKVSKAPFTDADMDVLSALCAVSATTFNNAILSENAKHSVLEIQKLYDVRYEVINRITHEFRTPLTIMKAGVEMLADANPESELLQIFLDSENRLEDLINSLLSLSQKTEPGTPEIKLSDPVTLLHDSVHRSSELAKSKNIHFKLRQSYDLRHPQVRIRDNDLQTALDALLENSIKFSPSGSTIRIDIELAADEPNIDRDGLQLPDWRKQTESEIREYLVSSPDELSVQLTEARQDGNGVGMMKQSDNNGYFVIRISDDGIGIPNRDLLSVAEPFRQASNSPDLGVKGTGLGLALVHKIVTRHGGHLCCRSTEGCGTTFSVFLPVETEAVL